MAHGELFLIFLFIAFIYASVGFGGGSSYLAVLALYALPFREIRLIALICNIIVVGGGVYIFIKNRQVNWKKIIPLVLAGMPMAFLGASIRISERTFFLILGTSLIVASLLLWLKNKPADMRVSEKKRSCVYDGLIGGGIGFLSGLAGIGGGIFLSPLLNLARWDDAKKIAATASVFILVNSLSGIAGQLTHMPADMDYTRAAVLAAAVFAGGQAGSRIGAAKFNLLIIRRVTAVLVFIAGVEVLGKHLF